MNNGEDLGLNEYNDFCRDLRAGNVLYNIDSTNLWGDYLLVVNVAPVKIGNVRTYTALLLGLKKENGRYVSRDLCISLTPDYANRIPFLKHVGYCRFNLIPVLEKVNIDVGLVTVYGNIDLHKFATKLSVRKPRAGKYGKDGKLVIKKPRN